MSHKDRLAEISQIRVKNNDCWMEILGLALELAPGRTKELMRKIKRNDNLISDIFQEIAKS